MSTRRLFPPVSGTGLTTSPLLSKATYSSSGGAAQDVNETDANLLMANGWVGAVGMGYSGTTAQRPANPVTTNGNNIYVDTTLGKVVTWDGANWRDPMTGAIS